MEVKRYITSPFSALLFVGMEKSSAAPAPTPADVVVVVDSSFVLLARDLLLMVDESS